MGAAWELRDGLKEKEGGQFSEPQQGFCQLTAPTILRAQLMVISSPL
jgi:hypothetical protein